MGRIVKIAGKNMIETAENNINSYAKTITNTAGKQVKQFGNQKGVSYGDAEPFPPTSMDTSCMMEFRPGEDYKGEYGFDWFREGDCFWDGNQRDFKNIVGKNCTSPNFTPDAEMLAKLENSYKRYYNPTFDKLYKVPRLTLRKGKTAVLDIINYISEELPCNISLEFADPEAENYLDITVLERLEKTPTGKTGRREKNKLQITCNEEFDHPQQLRVVIRDEHGFPTTCGELLIHPNSEKYQKKVKFLFIAVQTNLNGVVKETRFTDESLVLFTNLLEQALVIPQIKKAFITCTNLEFTDLLKKRKHIEYGTYPIQNKKQTGSATGWYISWINGVHELLNKHLEVLQLKKEYPPEEYYYMYFFNEGYTPGVEGYSNFGANFTVNLTVDKATAAHEYFHAAGLPHTFDEKSKKSLFTYHQKRTYNVMDYDMDKRIFLYHWQVRILNNQILRLD